MKAKWTSVILISMICFLTACSVGYTGSSKAKKAEIEFWHAMTGELEQTLEKMTADFNARNSSVQIKLVNQGNYTQLQEKLIAAAKVKQLPVLAQTYADWNDEFIRAGLVINLNTYLFDDETGWSQQELEDIYPVFLDENRWDGNYYSLPFNKSVQVLFYNKTLLDQYHVAVPTTWEEWSEAAAALTRSKPGGKGNIIGTGFENAVFREAYPYVMQAGGDFFDEQNRKVSFNTSDGQNGISFIQGMLQDGIARLAGEDQYMSTPFGRGDVAMFVGSSAGIAFVKNAVGDKFEWSTAVLPRGKQSVAFIQGTNISMFDNGSKEQQLEAWNYMKHLLNTENNAYWAERTGYLPIRKSVMELPGYQEYLQENPYFASASQQLQADQYLSKIAYANLMDPVLIKEMEAMLIGGKSVNEGLADADRKINDKLADREKTR